MNLKIDIHIHSINSFDSLIKIEDLQEISRSKGLDGVAITDHDKYFNGKVDGLVVIPGIEVSGIDISKYAIEHAKEEVKPYLRVGLAQELPYPDKSFDLVISINTIHNTYIYDVKKQIQEIERVGKKHKYIATESYRNEREKFNLMCWVLTGECFFEVKEWEWLFKEFGYTGDYSFIYFE